MFIDKPSDPRLNEEIFIERTQSGFDITRVSSIYDWRYCDELLQFSAEPFEKEGEDYSLLWSIKENANRAAQ